MTNFGISFDKIMIIGPRSQIESKIGKPTKENIKASPKWKNSAFKWWHNEKFDTWPYFLWMRDACLQPWHQTTNSWCDTLWQREEDTLDMESSPPGSLPFLAKCSPRLEDSTAHFWHSGKGGSSMFRIQTPLDPKHAQSHVWTTTWPFNYLHIQLCQNAVVSRDLRGVALPSTYKRFLPKHPSPKEAY